MWRWIAALGALLMLQAPATAAGPGIQAVVDPFEQVLDAMEMGMPVELVLESTVRALESRLRMDPSIAALERQRPGLVQTLSQASRPTLARYTARVRADFRPRFVAALRNRLTAEEAMEVAAFFHSAIGQKLLAATARSYEGAAARAALAQGEAISATDVQRDAGGATDSALAGLDEADRAEVAREAGSRPALLKLGPVQAEFSEIRALMERAPMNAAEQAMLNTAIQAALRAR